VITRTGNSRNRVALFMRFHVHMALEPVTVDKIRGDRNGESGVQECNHLFTPVEGLTVSGGDG
jgi:hypothetical protein